MSMISKIMAIYKIGGFRYIFAMINDKLKGTSKAPKVFYNICREAQASEYPWILENYYYICMDKKMKMDNPVTFSEKIQWLKIYDNSPIKTILCDKYLSRKWISDKIGEEHLIPLLGVWESYDDICFEKLPSSFVLKTNHGSGTNVVVRNKADFDIQYYRKVFEKWMDINFAFVHGFELQYRNVPVRIIAEKYMSTSDKAGLKDYRVFCFNGVPKQIWVDKYSGSDKHIRSIFDINWNKQPFTCTWPDGGDELAEKPKCLKEMLSFAKVLSEGFIFVRIDFYEIDGFVYVGELTFTPMSGMGKFTPESADRELGDWIVLPIDYSSKEFKNAIKCR